MEFLSREFRFTLALEIEAYSPFQMILTQSDGTPSPPTRMQKKNDQPYTNTRHRRDGPHR
jgi:hypothetical protein